MAAWGVAVVTGGCGSFQSWRWGGSLVSVPLPQQTFPVFPQPSAAWGAPGRVPRVWATCSVPPSYHSPVQRLCHGEIATGCRRCRVPGGARRLWKHLRWFGIWLKDLSTREPELPKARHLQRVQRATAMGQGAARGWQWGALEPTQQAAFLQGTRSVYHGERVSGR